jgi:predicted RNA-binding Zn-ribbon protein involved in translation (DUF1610 family)
MGLSLWHAAGEGCSRLSLDRPLWLRSDGPGDVVPTAEPHDNSVLLLPIEPFSQAIAVVLVPMRVAGQIAHNGVPLAAGLKELRHADCLTLGGATFWVSAEFAAVAAEYDPARHPPEAFCFLTKARLQAGDPIVICPGSADGPCGMIYRQAAWQMAQESAAFRCPNCGFAPSDASWAPPRPRSVGSLGELLELAARCSRGGGDETQPDE